MTPQILQLDSSGQPIRWIGWKEAVTIIAKDQVVWSLGEITATVRGGTSSKTGERTIVTTSAIIATKGSTHKRKRRPPALNNKGLFRRDRNVCAYCGKVFGDSRLTREHIVPISRGGPDAWLNVVSACQSCNSSKDNMTPEEAGMKLLYVPYVPSRVEALILSNKTILADQMEFLLALLPENSKLRI